MAELQTASLETAFGQVKDYLVETFKMFPASGRVWNRIRFAADTSEWLAIGAHDLGEGKIVIRTTCIYLAGFESSRSGKNVTLRPTYGIEVVHSFYDGTDGDNSTVVFEGHLAKILDHFTRDLNLGFTEGTEVTHGGIQGDEGGGRPLEVDGIIAHRKVLSIQPIFTVCR